MSDFNNIRGNNNNVQNHHSNQNVDPKNVTGSDNDTGKTVKAESGGFFSSIWKAICSPFRWIKSLFVNDNKPLESRSVAVHPSPKGGAQAADTTDNSKKTQADSPSLANLKKAVAESETTAKGMVQAKIDETGLDIEKLTQQADELAAASESFNKSGKTNQNNSGWFSWLTST